MCPPGDSKSSQIANEDQPSRIGVQFNKSVEQSFITFKFTHQLFEMIRASFYIPSLSY